jgi:hypothetical protein
MIQSAEFTISSFIFIFFLKNSIIKIIRYKKHKEQKTGNTDLSIALGPLAISKVTKGVIVSNILNNTIYFVFSILKKFLTKFISKIVKNMAEISNSKKNIKKNKYISTPSNI